MKSDFSRLVRKEIIANEASKGPITSLHQGFGLIAEEFEELKDEVFSRERKSDPHWLLSDLVQLSAKCEQLAKFLVTR